MTVSVTRLFLPPLALSIFPFYPPTPPPLETSPHSPTPFFSHSNSSSSTLASTPSFFTTTGRTKKKERRGERKYSLCEKKRDRNIEQEDERKRGDMCTNTTYQQHQLPEGKGISIDIYIQKYIHTYIFEFLWAYRRQSRIFTNRTDNNRPLAYGSPSSVPREYGTVAFKPPAD